MRPLYVLCSQIYNCKSHALFKSNIVKIQNLYISNPTICQQEFWGSLIANKGWILDRSWKQIGFSRFSSGISNQILSISSILGTKLQYSFHSKRYYTYKIIENLLLYTIIYSMVSKTWCGMCWNLGQHHIMKFINLWNCSKLSNIYV